ncbi:MAG: peptidylprolyl isomerase [Flavobacteriales bacterium]|nr:peptidylprolyl isomerase [Flavobacteriales bacterium]
MIDKIRSKGWLVIVVVGLGLILFLLPPDAINSLFGGGQNPTVGKINGDDIKQSQWTDLLQKRRVLYQNNSNVTGLSNEVWNDYVERSLLTDEYEELGLEITDEEFDGTMYGENLSPFNLSTFYNNTDSMALREKQRTYMEDRAEAAPDWYAGIIELAKSKRIKEKYTNLIKKGMYANKLDGKHTYAYQNNTVNIEFVVKTYAEVADSLITYNDRDLRAYYNKHKNDEEWKNIDDARVLEYITYSVLPSAEDSTSIKTELETLKPLWNTTTNDSVFVSAHSLGNTYIKLDYTDGQFKGPENANIVGDSVGSVIGPYADGTYIRLVKVLGRALDTQVDSVSVRHILFDNKQKSIDMALLRTKADSLKKVILKEKNFEAMVIKHSEDPGSKNIGGKYWVKKGQMVPPFEKASFEGKKGDLQIIDTDYGVHIVEVLEYDPQIMETQLSIIDRVIAGSEITKRGAKADALNFSSTYQDSVSFRNAADTMGLTVTPVPQLKRTDQKVGMLNSAGDVISWAFNTDTEIGQVSHPMQVDDQLLIALLLDKKEKGAPSYENVKDKVKREVINEKKAEYLIEKMNPGKNLQEVATAVVGSVKKADNLKMSSNTIPGTSGNEYEAVGLAYGIPEKSISKPIKGKNGVYVIAPTGPIVVAAEKGTYLEDQEKIIQNLQSRAVLTPYNSMKDNADIVDKRFGE